MAGVLRAGKLASRLSQTLQLQSQQTRTVGNLPVKTDKYIEQWATYREHIPFANGFKFDARTVGRIAMWVGVFPYFLYRVSTAEFNHSDELYHRKKRDML